MNHSHDFEVLQNIWGPLSNKAILTLHPDKEHQKEMERELENNKKDEGDDL